MPHRAITRYEIHCLDGGRYQVVDRWTGQVLSMVDDERVARNLLDCYQRAMHSEQPRHLAPEPPAFDASFWRSHA